MIREYVVNGDKLITEYITDGESFKNIDNSCFALLRAKGLVDKGKRVLMIDKEKTPGIAVFALLEVIKPEKIEKGKTYRSSDGFDVIWQPGEDRHSDNGYDCIITIRKQES
jgi:hypothetical protein